VTACAWETGSPPDGRGRGRAFIVSSREKTSSSAPQSSSSSPGWTARLRRSLAASCGSRSFAVPTSVGYGASFGGISALLAMLNSCAAGVTVVNIDNGFGRRSGGVSHQSRVGK